MAILSRITRLFKADVHAVLDQLEAPDAVLRQSIRDMENVLAEQSRQLKVLQQEQELARRRRGEIERALQATDEALDLSFAAGNEALARTTLRRKLEGERLIRVIAQRDAALEPRIAQLSAQIAQRQEAVDGMRQKAALLDVEAPERSGADWTRWGTEDVCVSEADIELALLREKQARRSA